MKSRILCVAFVLGLTSVSAIRADDDVWSKYTLPAGKYDVLLPGTPLKQTKTMRTPLGNIEVKVAAAVDLDKGVNYVVGTFEIPRGVVGKFGADEESVLDGMAHGFVLGGRGKVIRQEKVMIAGWPGREVRATIFDGAGELHGRFCLIDGRAYLLIVMAPADSLDARDAERFFDSFQPVAPVRPARQR